MERANILKLIFSIVICQLAGAVGSVFTSQSIPVWYTGLQKPAFAPPNWLFAPVWITLYLLMGISLYLIWRGGIGREKKPAIYTFALQLALNIIWSVIFFGLRNPLLAFLEIIALWLSIALTTFMFLKIDRRAAYLMVPYIVWVSIASALNYYIWVLNI